jgi:hypothetical protein
MTKSILVYSKLKVWVASSARSLSLNDLLFGIFHLILHLVLLDLELDLTLFFHFGEHHEGLLIIARI